MNSSSSADNFSIRGEGLYYHNKHPSLVLLRKHLAVKLPAVFLISSHHVKSYMDLMEHCFVFFFNIIKITSVTTKISFHLKKTLESPILWQRADGIPLC